MINMPTCEYVEELGKTHVTLCTLVATQCVECKIPSTQIKTKHNLCDAHANEYKDKYDAKEVKSLT